MESKEFQHLVKAEKGREKKQRSEKFWRAFLLTENGKVKSTLILNSFCLSFVFIGVYGIAFALLVEPLHQLTVGAPTALENLVQALVPAVAGTAVCCLSWLLPGEKRLMMAGYIWAALLMLACFVTMLILLGGDSQAQLLFLQMFSLVAIAPLVLGGAVSYLLYARWRKNNRPAAGTET